MTSSNPVYKRRRLDISPPQPPVSRTSLSKDSSIVSLYIVHMWWGLAFQALLMGFSSMGRQLNQASMEWQERGGVHWM